MTDAPHRRIEATIKVGADSLEDLEAALRSMEFDVYEKRENGQEKIDILSAGYSHSFTLRTEVDPEQTGDQYREQNKAYCAELKAARHAD